MKKLLLITTLIIFSFPNLSAQYVEAKINPIGALFQSPDVSVEYIVNENIGVEGKIGYRWSNNDFLGEVSRSTGFSFATLGKFYFKPEDDADRFYAGLYAKYARNTSSSNIDVFSDYDQTRVAIGALGGFKWVANNGIVLDFNVGAGRALVNKYNFNANADPNYIDLIEGIDLDFIGTLALGYRFEL